MANQKDFNDELIRGMDMLNKIERSTASAVDRAQDNIDECRRALEDAEEQYSRLVETKLQDEEELNTRRSKLGRLFGKTREEAVSEGTDIEALLAPVNLSTAAYLRTRGDDSELPDAEEDPEAITVTPREKDSQRLRTSDRQSTTLHLSAPTSATRSGLSGRGVCTSLDSVKTLQYLEHASTIVFTEAFTWVELRCPECGTNMLVGSHVLFKGGVAFQKHLNQMHKVALTVGDAIKRCTFREVPNDEVKRIFAGGYQGGPYVLPIAPQGHELPLDDQLPKIPETSQPRTDQESWDFVKDPKHFLAEYPCVVLTTSGEWRELHCPVCKCNATKQNKKFITGVRGFYDHVNDMHPESKISGDQGPGAVLKACTKRVLSVEGVTKLRDGIIGAPKVMKIFTIKPKTASLSAIPGGKGSPEQSNLSLAKGKQREAALNNPYAPGNPGRRPRESDGIDVCTAKRARFSTGSLVAYSDSEDGDMGVQVGDDVVQ